MNAIRSAATALIFASLAACSGLQYEIWPTDQFAAGNYQTYSWRSEPIENIAGSGDAIYRIDPLIRAETDKLLAAKGYSKVMWDGDFTIDYIYAPGLVIGVRGEDADIISPRIGIRPNTNVSQAQRDNAIALGTGVKETHNLALQINDGESRKEIWRGLVTKISQDTTPAASSSRNSAIYTGLGHLVGELPPAP